MADDLPRPVPGAPGPDDGPPEWPSLLEPRQGHGTREDRAWAVVTHLSLFAGGIVVPLVVVLVMERRSPYVCHHAAEALNFHTTVVLALLACSLMSYVLAGLLMLLVVLVMAAVLAVRGALSSSRGAWHRYPLSLRFVS